jgi:hypothetical protein
MLQQSPLTGLGSPCLCHDCKETHGVLTLRFRASLQRACILDKNCLNTNIYTSVDSTHCGFAETCLSLHENELL